jgi:hypothetical protein
MRLQRTKGTYQIPEPPASKYGIIATVAALRGFEAHAVDVSIGQVVVIDLVLQVGTLVDVRTGTVVANAI